MVSSTIFFVILGGCSVSCVVQARPGRCRFGTDRFDLEGDPVGRSWPGSTKGAAEVRVLLLELAHVGAPSIEVWTAMLGPQPNVLVEIASDR
jgi:hypothetical protein